DVEAADGAVGVAGAEQFAVDGVTAVHEREEVVVVDIAAQAEGGGASTEPPAGRLVTVEVVAAGPVDVVGAGIGALERGHPGGHGRPQHEPVHPSVLRCDACAAVGGPMASLLQREASG